MHLTPKDMEIQGDGGVGVPKLEMYCFLCVMVNMLVRGGCWPRDLRIYGFVLCCVALRLISLCYRFLLFFTSEDAGSRFIGSGTSLFGWRIRHIRQPGAWGEGSVCNEDE